ncbi:nuclear transport factor 2 family protein [Flavihumibacter petaseus]|uniref:SnoaL-like domain-containing protein n=1 Tax=Flavihumibacter petaseus NBRC 106054 TaxID=1220578 RepID=A0A0E9N2I7_9BACT|nr:nuclear transport factor 2 family protein [Flavihumibacter petaseus]GAO43540.1 hypothetical protein FPE01S_02_06450 [Flavihumibacter petaseus NBRC 106054]
MNRKEIVRKAIDGFVASDIEAALSYMTEDVKMGWPGYFDLAPGKSAVREFMTDMPETLSFGVGELIEDGDRIAATGTVTSKFKDGNIKNCFFCDIYFFEGDRIKEVKSYMVFEPPKDQSVPA